MVTCQNGSMLKQGCRRAVYYRFRPGYDKMLSVLLYADDVVLVAKDEQSLQSMLNNMCEWVDLNHMSINMSKSNVMHFRTKYMPQSQFVFKCKDQVLSYTDKYTYLFFFSFF